MRHLIVNLVLFNGGITTKTEQNRDFELHDTNDDTNESFTPGWAINLQRKGDGMWNLLGSCVREFLVGGPARSSRSHGA